MSNLKLKNICKKYSNTANNVLDNINLEIKEGEFVSIMGRSGSGKTTLLNVASTIDKIDTGQILFGNMDVSLLTDKNASEFRKNELGFVFQDYMLLDSLTIRENIAIALSLKQVKPQIVDDEVDKYARELDIYDHLEKYPYQLSGGQKQRASIIRAIIKSPLILFADEPTGALDLQTSKDIMNVFKYINRSKGITILMVTHDAVSASYSDRVVFLNDGRVQKELKNYHKDTFYEDIIKQLSKIGG